MFNIVINRSQLFVLLLCSWFHIHHKNILYLTFLLLPIKDISSFAIEYISVNSTKMMISICNFQASKRKPWCWFWNVCISNHERCLFIFLRQSKKHMEVDILFKMVHWLIILRVLLPIIFIFLLKYIIWRWAWNALSSDRVINYRTAVIIFYSLHSG